MPCKHLFSVAFEPFCLNSKTARVQLCFSSLIVKIRTTGERQTVCQQSTKYDLRDSLLFTFRHKCLVPPHQTETEFHEMLRLTLPAAAGEGSVSGVSRGATSALRWPAEPLPSRPASETLQMLLLTGGLSPGGLARVSDNVCFCGSQILTLFQDSACRG